ncbi:IS1634 family transposase [Butyrivibrio sp. INlla16]|uniref:IS1634 family transposase n=1 Tax=Butyrivibrio sp. INlla16 TaxID=1520807 RepID=UPI00087F70DE|nr:IS1634 family transposase [Butyrivibrio sp. INlla16]SDB69823.1 Transposase DDE domain-containing protein [Butyrivibrio sp. INlla16]
MYLRQINRPQGIYLAIQESYYDREKRQSRTRTVQSLGYLEKLKAQYDDPVAYFTQYARELTEKNKTEKSADIAIDLKSTMEIGTNDVRNVGYGILKSLYKDLEIDKFWNWKTRGRKMKFSTDQITKLLTFSRALNPGSKRYTLNSSDFFFEPFDDCSLDDIYHALDIIADNKDDLQKWVYEKSQKICKRDMSVSYFDCTNYYFDISRPDVDSTDDDGNPIDENGNPTDAGYRKRGPEKNHRPDPIVEMGLLMDKNGIPMAFDLFPGNESEKVHMRPIINRVKNTFDDCRVIYVADRGLNTSDNIYWLNGDNKGENNTRDGYVYGQSVRGADAEFKEWVLKGDYRNEKVLDDNGHEITFRHKSRIFPKELHVNVTKPGQKKNVKKKVVVDQKQLVYYSEKYAKKQKADREAMISRANDLIRHPKKYNRVTARGSASYVVNIAFDKKTGEIVEGRNLELDIEKIREEEKYDGYYSIVTSELKMSDEEMRKVYRGLARIEDSFKVTKTFFESRPVFLRTNKHIDAHFTTCFLALLLVRLLETKLEGKYQAGRILNSLKKYNCTKLHTNLWRFTYYDEVIDACSRAFGITLNLQNRRQQDIQRLLRY